MERWGKHGDRKLRVRGLGKMIKERQREGERANRGGKEGGGQGGGWHGQLL